MEKTAPKLELITKYFPQLSKKQTEQFASLDALYREWNAQINVISRKDIDSLYEKHVLHSLSIAAVFDFPKDTIILDIGTGGGFPGIPLAIFFPEARFHLVDSIAKKIKVVEAVAGSIGLTNVTAEQIRGEEIKNMKFDAVVTRAVAPLKALWQWSKPMLKKKPLQPLIDGQLPMGRGLISLKGGDLKQEISDSGCKPAITDISTLFEEACFQDKYLLQILPK
jgi:16S rRNA (guanine527-N7)-methyltransferase